MLHASIEDEEGNIFCVFPAGSAYLVVCYSLGIEFFTEQVSGIKAVARILQGFYGIKLKDGQEARLTEFSKMNEENGKGRNSDV
jgi:hypothetical protein